MIDEVLRERQSGCAEFSASLAATRVYPPTCWSAPPNLSLIVGPTTAAQKFCATPRGNPLKSVWEIDASQSSTSLPHGHQPMNDPATGNWIVYNGEVYNFREVRTKLEQAGLTFRSNSDTEVILKAYGHWGEKCLHEFRGMFAFAIWDAHRQRMFVARDPMGIKPLYLYRSDRYFIFSSEVRALLGTNLMPRVIDCAGLVNYLTFGSLYDPNTLVDGVEALPPGCYLTWEEGRVKQEQYWDLVGPNPGAGCDHSADAGPEKRSELESQIAEMLDESVRIQLVSDVPVGVFLSGGIDSSSLVGILSRNGVRPSTFSIVFSEEDYSEAEYSRAVAQHFNTDHHEITVTQSDFFAAIDPAIRAMDLPTIDGINTYFVSEQTRAAGVKVVLSGLGGDEMFAGYSSFRTVPRMERFSTTWNHMPGAVRSPLVNTFAALAPSSDQNRKLTALGRNGGGVAHPYFLSRMVFTPEQQNALLSGMKTNSAALVRAQKPLTESLAAPKAWTRSTAFPIWRRAVICSTHCYGIPTS